MIVDGLCFDIFRITAMSNFSQAETPDMLSGKGTPNKFSMNNTIISSKGNQSFRVKKESDISSNTKAWIKIVSSVSCDTNRVRISLNIKSADRSQFMVIEYHPCSSLPFLRFAVVLNVPVMENVFVFRNDVEAPVKNFPIFLTINVVSQLVSG